MKLLYRYDCYVVFSHCDRGLPTHDHFKILNCPSSNSGWKNRYFFMKPVDGIFAFPLNWSVTLLEDFNSTPIQTEPEIDSLIILRKTEPLGRSMNDALTDDALVLAGIGRPYDQFTENFLEELARKNSRGQRKRRRKTRLVDSPSSDAAPSSGQQAALPVESLVAQTVTVQTGTLESSRPRSPRVASKSRPTCNMRRTIEKVTEDVQAISSCLDCEQTGNKVQSLKDTIAQLSQELTVKGKVAIEEYKGSEEYMTTVGMVGVRGRDMAFRKSRE
ncbi:hypothetical protein Adt_03680 [Abeliophyllum distichum]|uniref:Uncharacterized protein n=1 Tax=Abeliophyllum distichum TaxID=126358 RepID=A0ABD1VZE9_9LAMI